jgi:crotonobetainyl-CoA:carnitine CoA-transferase CaiB-like acyl-CoA transferase
VTYEDLRAVNPSLIYCHTAGFDDTRADLPGNDQTAGALTGVLYEDGGCADGGRPPWSLTSLGDTGCGYLSALAVLLAILHRDRTGQGQLVDTSIVRAHLLNASQAWLHGDGTPAERDRLDRDQLGPDALRRLYPTAEGWIAIVARTDREWLALCHALGRPDLAEDPGLRTATARRGARRRLAWELEQAFASRSANEWCERLDAAMVPCEVAHEEVALAVLDDEDLRARGWVTSYEQGDVGRLDQRGMPFDFEETRTAVAGPPLVVGDASREVLRDFGWDDAEIDELVDARVVFESARTRRTPP